MESVNKNFREAQNQAGLEKANQAQKEEMQEPEVMVDQRVKQEAQSDARNEVPSREDAIQDSLKDPIADPMKGAMKGDDKNVQKSGKNPQLIPPEAFPGSKDGAPKKAPKRKRTPLRKVVRISKKLGLKHATDAFKDDDPHAFVKLSQELRLLATKQLDDAEIGMLEDFQTELKLLRKQVKKSASDTDLSAHEVAKLESVLQRLINVQNLLQESDLPFVIDRDEEPSDGDVKIEHVEELDDFYIDPNDKEALLDDEIFKVIIEEEEVDGYTHWSQPILQLLKVGKANSLR